MVTRKEQGMFRSEIVGHFYGYTLGGPSSLADLARASGHSSVQLMNTKQILWPALSWIPCLFYLNQKDGNSKL
jgi:hypothetical protein